MEKFEEKIQTAMTPGAPCAKLYFGLLFFAIALLIVIFGLWKTLFIAAVTALGVFIGSAETLGKATAKLIDKVFPHKNQKVVYTKEDLEKVRRAAEMKREAQEKAAQAAQQDEGKA